MSAGFRPSAIGFWILALLLSSASVPAAAQYADSLPVPDDLKQGFETITAEQANQWLNVLAGPVFEGRGTGQPGYTKAAHWVAGKVAEFGLEPLGDDGTYFQRLPMSRLTLDPAQSFLLGPGDCKLEASGNFGLERFLDQARASGKLAFVKLAGENPQLGENNALRDRFVIYLADEAAARRAPRLIASQGPAAALRIVPDSPQPASQTTQSGGRSRSTSASGTIWIEAARKLVAAAGGQPDWVEWKTGDATSVQLLDAEATLELRIREEPLAVPNVVAWLPGSDPALRDEYLVIGAHLDHLGTRSDGVYPGADDNGSGSTAILSIARALATNPVKPKRSVLFIWFAAEEIGLVGSRHYTDNPRLPLDKMICMLNIDMVGRNEEQPGETAAENVESIHLIGSEQGDKALHQIILDANQHLKFRFEFDQEDVFGRSDQANFFRKGISVAFLFGGFHPDYHQTGDLPSKINYEKIANAARLYYLTAFRAAEHGSFRFEVPKSEESGSANPGSASRSSASPGSTNSGSGN